MKNSIKVATAATAFACIWGSPTYSQAAEGVSLETQLKQLQDIKVSNQKRRIEAAELELQSRELLYPEGRLIGRGIIKLMPEDGKLLYFYFIFGMIASFSVQNVLMVFLHYLGDMKTFPYGLPDPVSFDSNFIDKRSTLIILAVGRYDDL